MSEAEANRGKNRQLAVLSAAELLAMTLWLSASAVVPQLRQHWALSDGQAAWLTMSVQLGFVVGALVSAALNLPDRISTGRLIAISTLGAAAANAAIPALHLGWDASLAMRFCTGFLLAGVYPPGMKFVASWAVSDRGLGIGILVGALTIGTATPHLITAQESGMPNWRAVLWATSALATLASLLALGLREGPHLVRASQFHWRHAGRALSHRPTRLANFGYLGHMWELYAMWAWVPVLLLVSYQTAGWSTTAARLAAFSVIAVGAIGSVLAGLWADRLGRTTITMASLALSGSCALLAGAFFNQPVVLTVLCLIWGFAVVADSAQFSAAVSELSDPRYVGTALTVQTSLGFLLTLLTLRLVPALVDGRGWQVAMAALAIGPAFGFWSMWQLRRDPEAVKMAAGRR